VKSLDLGEPEDLQAIVSAPAAIILLFTHAVGSEEGVLLHFPIEAADK
jgi:hypothetical protein